MSAPKGKMLIIGGAEDIGDRDYPRVRDECQRYEILKELLPNSKDKRIEVITTASEAQERVKQIYQEAFQRIGFIDPGFMPIKNRMEARDPAFLERAQKVAVRPLYG